MTTGSFWFGVVIGFITYRTLKRKASTGISDIASVIGALGGAGVLRLFPAGTTQFDAYATGLAAGFFGYLALSLIIAAIYAEGGSPRKGASAANEFLGS